jgi:putative transposase
MVRHASEYPWSSYAANAEAKGVKWLVPHGEYLAVGLTAESRRAAYRGLFANELEPELLKGIRGAAHAGYAIGSQRFQVEIEAAMMDRAMRQPRTSYAVAML